VTLEKEWMRVDVSVMRVRTEQLPALRAALSEYGKLEVVGTTQRSCTLVVWRNEQMGAPTDRGGSRRGPYSLRPDTAIVLGTGPEVDTEQVPAVRAAFAIDPNRPWLGRRFGRFGAAGGVQPYPRVTTDREDRELRMGPFPTDGLSWTVGPTRRSLVAGVA
jgi:hypothetical protein